MSLPTAKEVVEAARKGAERIAREQAEREAEERAETRKARWLGAVLIVIIVMLAVLIRL